MAPLRVLFCAAGCTRARQPSKRALMIVMVVSLLSRCNPVRMMLLHPRTIVLNPPVAIMPLMMLVVVAHSRRRRRVCVSRRPSVTVCGRRGGVSVCGSRRISIRRRLRVPMSAIKACLECRCPNHENQRFQDRENFASHPHPSTQMKEHQGCQRRRSGNRMVSRIARGQGNPNFPAMHQKIHALTTASR